MQAARPMAEETAPVREATAQPVIVVAPAKGPEERVRLRKLVQLLQSLGHPVEFWGWERGGEQTEPHPDLTLRILHRGGGYGGKAMLIHYPRWMAKLWWNFLFKTNGRPLYCLSFDTAVSAAFAFRRRFLFDEADNFSMLSNWPGWMRKLFELCENIAAKRAKIHLLPSKFRTKQVRANDRFLPNMPTRDAVEQAKQMAAERGYAPGPVLTVLVTGRLVKDRGVGEILAAYRKLGPETVHLLIAGRTFAEEAEELVKEPGVEYLGVVTNEEALALNYRAHLTLTYYDPAIEINRVAEPNKWGDCIVTNTPFIVNSEVVTAKEYIDAGACFAVPYNNVDALAALLRRLADNRQELAEVKARLANFSASAWDDGMRKIIEEWLA